MRADTWQHVDCPMCKQSIQIRIHTPEDDMLTPAELIIVGGDNKLAKYNPMIKQLEGDSAIKIEHKETHLWLV